MMKTALVTGGSSGIGAAIARALARQGMQVAVVAGSSQAKAQAEIDSWGGDGARAKAYHADVADSRSVDALVSRVENDLGEVNVLVNSAGIFERSVPGQTDPDQSRRMVEINLTGTWNCINAVVPRMRKQGGGDVLNIASVGGTIGIRDFSLYCATKAAIIMLTRSLAGELGKSGIRVNALAPGNTATPMNVAVRTGEDGEANIEAMSKITPSGVAFSDPAEIAQLALFLLSPSARPVRGATLVADEGISTVIV